MDPRDHDVGVSDGPRNSDLFGGKGKVPVSAEHLDAVLEVVERPVNVDCSLLVSSMSVFVDGGMKGDDVGEDVLLFDGIWVWDKHGDAKVVVGIKVRGCHVSISEPWRKIQSPLDDEAEDSHP